MLRSRGKLFAGALFAGTLFGAQEVATPPQEPQSGGGGFYAHQAPYKSKFYELKKRDDTKQILEVRNIEQEEEEAVVLFVITELFRRGIL